MTSSEIPSPRTTFPVTLRVALGLVLGALVGLWIGPKAQGFGEVGAIFIKVLKALATPLVFIAIVDAFCKTSIPARKGGELIFISFCNFLVAIVIAITMAHLTSGLAGHLDLGLLKMAAANAPTNSNAFTPLYLLQISAAVDFILGPLLKLNIIYVIVCALIFGIGYRLLKLQSSMQKKPRVLQLNRFETYVARAFEFISHVLSYFVLVVPFAVFAIVAKAVGTSGLQVFHVLIYFVGIVAAGMIIHAVVYYSFLLKFIAKKSPALFYKEGSEAIATAMGTGSSLATLPVTLKVLKKMKISDSSARLAAVVGTNFNHDGILLYEAAAVYFVMQLQGTQLTVWTEVKIALTAVLGAVGIAGIPDAGFLTLSIVLGAVGLPLSSASFLLPVDWLIGRMRATVNVISDMTVATILDQHAQKTARKKKPSSRSLRTKS